MARGKILSQRITVKDSFFKLPCNGHYNRVITNPSKPKGVKLSQSTVYIYNNKQNQMKALFILPTIKRDELGHWWFYWFTYRKRLK